MDSQNGLGRRIREEVIIQNASKRKFVHTRRKENIKKTHCGIIFACRFLTSYSQKGRRALSALILDHRR